MGLVAAATLKIVNWTQDLSYQAAYKKATSNLSQAVLKARTDDLLIDAQSYTPRPSDFDKNFLSIMSEFKVAKQCTTYNNSQCWDVNGEKFYGGGNWWPGSTEYAFIDSSGMAWSQFWEGSNIVFVDTNGFKKPNQMGKDRFAFFLPNSSSNTSQDGLPIKVFPFANNSGSICLTPNVCTTQHNYFGTSWLYGK